MFGLVPDAGDAVVPDEIRFDSVAITIGSAQPLI
jgi:hypothetical protein